MKTETQVGSAMQGYAPTPIPKHTSEPGPTMMAGNVVANEAVTRIGVPAALVSGTVLAVIGAMTEYWALLGIGLMALGLVILVRWQTVHGGDRSTHILILVSTTFGFLAPFAEGGLAISIVPVVVILGFLGIFATTRRGAIRLGLWCVALILWSIPWIYRELAVSDALVMMVVLGGTAVSAFVVFVWADQARVRQEQKFWFLFESSPTATWELDCSGLENWLDGLRAEGVENLRTYLTRDPDRIVEALSEIRIKHSNSSAKQMFALMPLGQVVIEHLTTRGVNELESFIDVIESVWEGRTYLGLDVTGLRVAGRRLDAVMHWAVDEAKGAPDFSKVVVTMSDTTPQREAEEKLAVALASNQLLMGHERAMAICSQALLLGTGDQSVAFALDTLRSAIGADVAYLAKNVEDREIGPALRVVASARDGEASAEGESGVVVGWDRWPDAMKVLARGGVHRAVLTAEDGSSIARLGVPVFAGGQWLGAFRFDHRGRTDWSDAVVRLLEVAAPMFGAHWERERSHGQLERLVESKDQFIASVSHELRTPLSAVIGFAEYLKTEGGTLETDDLTEMLETIASQSQDMSHMVEDLLVAARADIGTVSIDPGEVYLRAQAEVAVSGIDTSDLASIEVRGGHGKCWADPTRTRQIVRNLLTNAIRYGGKNVVVECFAEGNETVLLVIDDGSGIPESEWETIFEPYHRAHEIPTQTASIGLGLTVSRQLARLMNGDLTYRMTPEGSTFDLRLPTEDPNLHT